MKDLELKIVPKVGLGELKFGTSMDAVVELLGKADEVEEFNDDDCFNTTILTYNTPEMDLFFEGSDKLVLSGINLENEEATLYDLQVFDMSEEEIVKMMNDNGYFEFDTNIDEEYNEKCLSFEEANLDFIFDEEGSLISVSFGILVSEDGQIINL
ncbi:MAG: hypothetical protein PHR20_04565 [Bacteroidales bacterium]|nr:hypothetical protein [Bacteroidales bacterium]